MKRKISIICIVALFITAIGFLREDTRVQADSPSICSVGATESPMVLPTQTPSPRVIQTPSPTMTPPPAEYPKSLDRVVKSTRGTLHCYGTDYGEGFMIDKATFKLKSNVYLRGADIKVYKDNRCVSKAGSGYFNKSSRTFTFTSEGVWNIQIKVKRHKRQKGYTIKLRSGVPIQIPKYVSFSRYFVTV